MSPSPSLPRIAAEPCTRRTRGWADYALLDSGRGRKLERYGGVTVVRPEPQSGWSPRLEDAAWTGADATFDPKAQDGAQDDEAGRWRTAHALPERWPLAWGAARFHARLTPFRHLGFFPEQAANWALIDAEARAAAAGGKRPRLLNLFGYTGVASLVAAAAGAEVTHVDASRKAVAYARENAALSSLADAPIRWVVEDARRYVQREGRRGSLYDAVVLDPPKHGRGPAGEVWRVFEDTPGLVRDCAALLAPDARFMLLNAYAARLSGLSLAHLMAEALPGRGGRVAWGELALEEEAAFPRAVGLSFYALWTRA